MRRPFRRVDRPCRRIGFKSAGREKRIRVNIAHREPASAAPVRLLGSVSGPVLSARRRLVDIQFYGPAAHSVSVVGKFVDERTRKIPLEHLGGGAWVARVILSPGQYEYHFLADGTMTPDPLATESSCGPDGEIKSVMVIE